MKKRRCPTPSQTRGTLAYFKLVSWSSLNARTVNGSRPNWKNPKIVSTYLGQGVRLGMTKEVFYSWCELHKNRILRLYSGGQTPSIDRIDTTKPYCIKNIRILELLENAERGSETRRRLLSKPVVSINVSTGVKTKYASIAEAARMLGSNRVQIGHCIHKRNRMRTHAGCYWKFASTENT